MGSEDSERVRAIAEWLTEEVVNNSAGIKMITDPYRLPGRDRHPQPEAASSNDAPACWASPTSALPQRTTTERAVRELMSVSG